MLPGKVEGSPTATTPSTCTIYDAPFALGHTVSFVGFGGSLVCKFANLVTAPYATTAAVFFGVLSLITCFGQYRSRNNFLAEKKIIQSIANQNTELQNVSVRVGGAADVLAGVDEDWKRQTAQLASDKKTLEQQNDALTQLCATLNKENRDLKSTADRIADSAKSDATAVARLADSTRTLATDLAAGAASEAALKTDAGQISVDLGNFKNDSQKLQGSVQKVAALVKTLSTPTAGGGTDAVAGSLAALAQSTREQIDQLK